MICTADTVGTFQIESRAQMSMLPRLRPRTFYDLVVEVALVRPGPISGGMVHPYLRRRNGLEPVEYPHPCLEPVLAKTLGVPLFQEQVMQLAVRRRRLHAGRGRPAAPRHGRVAPLRPHREAPRAPDRAHGGEGHRARVRRARVRADPRLRRVRLSREPRRELRADRVRDVRGCASTTCAEFTCSLLNAQPMGFYSPATIVGDAQRHGARDPADRCHAQRRGTARSSRRDDDFGFAVRMGLRWVKGMQLAEGERDRRGAARARRSRRVEDFVRRTHLPARTHTALAEAGALGALVRERRDALWQVTGWVRAAGRSARPRRRRQRRRRGSRGSAKLDEIFWDYRASDHSTRGHPLAPLRGELRAQRLARCARRWRSGRDGQRIEYVGIVICRQQPGTASRRVFMTLEDETGFVNLVVWAQVFARVRARDQDDVAARRHRPAAGAGGHRPPDRRAACGCRSCRGRWPRSTAATSTSAGAQRSCLTASTTSSTWPFTLTFGQCWATLPALSITTVERMMPFIFLPYITLSPHAP